MLNIILKLIIIQIIIVFIVDLSGFITSLKLFISNKITNGKMSTTNFSLKPFSCSLCMTWWIGLLYILLIHHFTIPLIGVVCLLAFLTPVTMNFLLLIKDLINKLLDTIYENVIKRTV